MKKLMILTNLYNVYKKLMKIIVILPLKDLIIIMLKPFPRNC